MKFTKMQGCGNDYVYVNGFVYEIDEPEELSKKVMEFKLASESFDIYGISIVESGNGPLFSSTDTDLDRQMRLAETKFCSEGIGNLYGQVYYNPDNENEYKIDVILFVRESISCSSLKDTIIFFVISLLNL